MEIAWRNYKAIGTVSTAYGLTISIESASTGAHPTPTKWKSAITIEADEYEHHKKR
jgi:hypothetical protein